MKYKLRMNYQVRLVTEKNIKKGRHKRKLINKNLLRKIKNLIFVVVKNYSYKLKKYIKHT